ncbi:MAG: ISL3 family transposase [Thermodesulfobacteriota bacterium]
MDYTLLKELLNLPRVQVEDFKQTEHEILITVSIGYNQHRCPKCGHKFSRVSEITESRVRDLPVFGKTCYLLIRKGRLHCPCSFRGYEEIDFVDKNQRQTKRFDEFLFALCDRMTLMDASELMRVNWKRAHDIDKKTLNKLKVETPLPQLSVIGVDEISFEKYHKYFTIVYDLSTKKGVLFVSKGRNKESLDEFFKELSKTQKQNLKAVCMDMWDPYIKSVKESIPHVAIVFDRFHLKKHLNSCIDDLRRSIAREQGLSKEERKILKNKRWVLLKTQQNHTLKDKQSLEELKKINSPLYEGYLIKEQFEQFYVSENEKQGKQFIQDWFIQIPESIKAFFEPFFRLLQRYLFGITAFFQFRYTNSIAEGINNKIKVLKRMAYGYHDQEYFKLKILRKCGYLKFIKPNF